MSKNTTTSVSPTGPADKPGVPPELKRLGAIRQRPTLFTVCNDSIGRNLVYAVADEIGNCHFEALDWVIVTWGGSAEAGFMTAKMIREQVRDLTVVIPAQCSSAGTSMAMAADTLIFSKTGTLSALDCQVDHASQDGVVAMESSLATRDSMQEVQEVSTDFLRMALAEIRSSTDLAQPEALRAATELVGAVMSPLMSRVDFELLGDRRRLRNVGRTYAEELLGQVGYVDDERKARILEDLCFGLPTHGWPIRWDHAALIGLNAELATGELADALDALAMFWDYDGKFCCLVEPETADAAGEHADPASTTEGSGS